MVLIKWVNEIIGKKLKGLFRIVIFVVCICMSSTAMANYVCAGQVYGVSISPKSGALMAERIGPLSWPQLCKLNIEYEGVSAETCQAIYSMLLAAQMSQKNVTLWFNDGKDCSAESHPPWQLLTGWYFGPRIH